MNHGFAAIDQFQRSRRFACVAENQFNAAIDQELSVAGRPHQTAHLVAAFDQERNETVTQKTGCACDSNHINDKLKITNGACCVLRIA
jgi:hypothetical protein